MVLFIKLLLRNIKLKSSNVAFHFCIFLQLSHVFEYHSHLIVLVRLQEMAQIWVILVRQKLRSYLRHLHCISKRNVKQKCKVFVDVFGLICSKALEGRQPPNASLSETAPNYIKSNL